MICITIVWPANQPNKLKTLVLDQSSHKTNLYLPSLKRKWLSVNKKFTVIKLLCYYPVKLIMIYFSSQEKFRRMGRGRMRYWGVNGRTAFVECNVVDFSSLLLIHLCFCLPLYLWYVVRGISWIWLYIKHRCLYPIIFLYMPVPFCS